MFLFLALAVLVGLCEYQVLLVGSELQYLSLPPSLSTPLSLLDPLCSLSPFCSLRRSFLSHDIGTPGITPLLHSLEIIGNLLLSHVL